MTKEHYEIIHRLGNVLIRRGQVTTKSLTELVQKLFPEYRDTDPQELEYLITTIVYSDGIN